MTATRSAVDNENRDSSESCQSYAPYNNITRVQEAHAQKIMQNSGTTLNKYGRRLHSI